MTKKCYGSVFFLFMIMAFFYIFNVKPPFSSPDEFVHLGRAFGILNNYAILKPVGNEGASGAIINDTLMNATKTMEPAIMRSNARIVMDSMVKIKSLQWSKSYAPMAMPSAAFYPPVIYAPHVISFYIGKNLGLNFYHSYGLANFVTYISCILLLLLAYRIYPIPILSLTVLLLPMTLFQIMSPTIDGLSISLSTLAMSLFMKMLTEDNDKKYIIYGIAIAYCIFAAIGGKTNLFLMTLIPVWLFYITKKKVNLVIFFICVAVTFSWIVFTVFNVHDASLGRHPGYSDSQLIIYYIKHPILLLKIIRNTLLNPILRYFYYESFIGTLAWLDAPIAYIERSYFSVLIILSIVLSLLFQLKDKKLFQSVVFRRGFSSIATPYNLNAQPCSRKKNTWKVTAFILFLAIASSALIFPALLVQWNAFPTTQIEGVQGRYFIIPAIILGYAFPIDKKYYKYYLPILFLSLIYSIFSIHNALYKRYFSIASTSTNIAILKS